MTKSKRRSNKSKKSSESTDSSSSLCSSRSSSKSSSESSSKSHSSHKHNKHHKKQVCPQLPRLRFPQYQKYNQSHFIKRKYPLYKTGSCHIKKRDCNANYVYSSDSDSDSEKPKKSLQHNIKKYKHKLQIVKDTIILFDFIKNKIESTYLLFNYCHHKFNKNNKNNKKWLEQLLERLLCAVSQDNLFKNIKVKYRKVKINESRQRKYIITVKNKNNDVKSNKKYKFVINYPYCLDNGMIIKNLLVRIVKDIDENLRKLKAKSVKPFTS